MVSENEIVKRRKAAAERAIEEARQRAAVKVVERRASERGGQEGPEPTRYGDWEKEGIICDF
jgi:hypothetical protein